MKAQKLAAEKTHGERSQEWLYSSEGLKDTRNSINEIYSLIQQQISGNAETFATLGIELSAEEKLLRNIFTYKFGCQLNVEGFREHSYDNKAANRGLRIVLFKKNRRFNGETYFLPKQLNTFISNQAITRRSSDLERARKYFYELICGRHL